MLLNLKRAEAARFSFLLGIPAIVLSGLLELKHMTEGGLTADNISTLSTGLFVSAVVSYVAIAWLLRYLQNHATWIFVGYRILFGVVIFILAGQQLIH
jgi:undecaprenyl-diphosphatase